MMFDEEVEQERSSLIYAMIPVFKSVLTNLFTNYYYYLHHCGLCVFFIKIIHTYILVF